MEMSDKRGPLPLSPCLGCGYGMDAATDVEGTSTPPSPGDVAICLNCGYIALYDDGMKLRDLTSDEMYEVAGDPMILAAQKVRAAFHRGRKR